jgi:hypothetical protein
MRFDFLYNIFLQTFTILRLFRRDRSNMYIGLHVKYRHSCQISMKVEFFRHIVNKYSNLIFMDPCIVDDSVEISKRCNFVIEFITPKFTVG